MTIVTTTKGQADLPRYFAQVLKVLEKLQLGRLDFVLPDGRRFRAEGREPGPAAEILVKNADVFSRLIREGDLGFCDAYLDGDWDTPDLQAFMDLVQAPQNNGVNDGFPALVWCAPTSGCGTGFGRTTAGRRARISRITMILGMNFTDCGSTRR